MEDLFHTKNGLEHPEVPEYQNAGARANMLVVARASPGAFFPKAILPEPLFGSDLLLKRLLLVPAS